MAGRLGAPNAGRLTTSAFLKSSGAIFGPAADAFFLIPYKSALATDNLNISRSVSAGWNMSTVISDSVDLGTELLRGAQQGGILSDSMTLSEPVTNAGYLKTAVDTIDVLESRVVDTPRDVFMPPGTSSLIFGDLSNSEPLPYSSAASAFSAWLAERAGLSVITPSVAGFTANYGGAPIDIGFGVLGPYPSIWIDKGHGGIGLFETAPTVTTISNVGSIGTSAAGYFYNTYMPNGDYYNFLIGMTDNNGYEGYLTDIVVKVYPSIPEAVVYLSLARIYSTQVLQIAAYRLRPNYIEAVFTVGGATVQGMRPMYATCFDTSILTARRFTQEMTNNTLYVKSSDILGALRPYVLDVSTITDSVPVQSFLVPEEYEFFEVSETLPIGFGTTINKSITASETLSLTLKPGPIIDEVLNTQDALSAKATYGLTQLERTQIRDALLRAFPNTLTDSAAVTDLATSVRALLVLERLNINSAAGALAKYTATFAEALRISDSLRNFFGEDVSDSLTFADATLRTYKLPRSATESISVADVLANKLTFRITAADSVDIDDIDILKLLFKPTLLDGVDITAAYVSPNGNLTTWAVNTETGAVTEYTNYSFNSFAQIGRKYLGASSGGLYELNGDDDAGTDIIATLKSGLAQFGGSRFSMFKAAYLGVRGGGDFVFRLETGDGKYYDYEVVAQDMQTTKIRLGKGLRARYFSFQLTSTGQDFDMDAVEFVPLVAQRRV